MADKTKIFIGYDMRGGWKGPYKRLKPFPSEYSGWELMVATKPSWFFTLHTKMLLVLLGAI
jgi:hypothetical protein